MTIFFSNLNRADINYLRIRPAARVFEITGDFPVCFGDNQSRISLETRAPVRFGKFNAGFIENRLHIRFVEFEDSFDKIGAERVLAFQNAQLHYLANSSSTFSTRRSSSAVTSGAKRAVISPFLPTRNFSKFHKTSPGVERLCP